MLHTTRCAIHDAAQLNAVMHDWLRRAPAASCWVPPPWDCHCSSLRPRCSSKTGLQCSLVMRWVPPASWLGQQSQLSRDCVTRHEFGDFGDCS